MLSFVGDTLVSGPDPWMYKYTNLIIHLLCGCLIFWLCGRLLQSVPSTATRSWSWALWVAALWLCSPLMVSTVLYVVQRMAQLSAFFCLAGLLLYVVGRQNLARNFRLGAGLILAAFLICWPAATFSKESGALFPLLAFVVEIFIFRNEGSPVERRFIRTVYVVALLLPAVLFFVGVVLRPGFVLDGYAQRNFTFVERILTEPRILFDYVQQLVLPQGGRMGLFHDDFPISRGLFKPATTVLALLAWFGLLGWGWIQRHSPHRLIWFGLWFFIAGQLLESTIFSLELYFEHRNYLPGLGIYLTIVGVASAVAVHLTPRHRKLIAVFIGAVPLVFALAMSQRVLAWRNTAQMFLTMEPWHAKSPRLASELALWFAQHGDPKNAQQQLDRLDRLVPDESGPATVRLLVHCFERGPLTKSEKERLARVHAIAMDTLTTGGVLELAKLKADGQCPVVPIRYLSDLLDTWWRNTRYPPDRTTLWNLHIAMANIFRMDKRYAAALAHLEAASELRPGLLDPAMIEVDIRLEQGDFAAAQADLDRIRKNDVHRFQFQDRMISNFQHYIDLHANDGKVAP
jgi:hypothetical protein